MSKKILGVATLGLFGGKKKKAAAAATEETGPKVTPLAGTDAAVKKQPAWRGMAPSPAATILSDKLGS